MNENQKAVTPRHLEHFVKRAVKYLGCDTARISYPCETYFLIIGTNKNTKTDGKAGQWIKDGEPFDFDYVEEHVIANGKDLKELWVSVKWYKKVQKEGWKAYGLPFA